MTASTEPRRARRGRLTEILNRISRDDRVRREFLWLRAQETEDWPSVRMLEQADPDLRRRTAEMIDAAGEPLPKCARARRDFFGRLYEAHWRHHAGADFWGDRS